MFSTLIENEIKRRGISIREAARQIGISHTTLIAIRKGRPLEVDTAAAICKWLGVPITAAVEGTIGNQRAIEAIAIILATEPELEKVFIAAAEEVDKGHLTLGDFKEILDFAAFKMQQRLAKTQAEEASRVTS